MTTATKVHLLVGVVLLGTVGHGIALAISGGGPSRIDLGRVFFCLLIMVIGLVLAADIFRNCHLRCDGDASCEMQCINSYLLSALLVFLFFFLCAF